VTIEVTGQNPTRLMKLL